MAIIYTYPNLPLSSLSAEDLLVITNVDATNNNPTRSVTLADIATYVTGTGSGTGTTNKIVKFTDGANGLLGDSIMTESTGLIDLAGQFVSTSSPTLTQGAPVSGIKAILNGTTAAPNVALYGESKHTGGTQADSNYGLFAKGEFEGTGGFTGFVIGGNLEGRYDGTGTNGANANVYGSYNLARSTSAANGVIDYHVGHLSVSKIESANVTANNLQGAHTSVDLTNGTAGDVIVQILDFDGTGGTVTGDLSYLQIQNDTMPTVAGTKRAINSLSVLPSLFTGQVEIPLVPTINAHATSKQYVDQQISSVVSGLVFISTWDARTQAEGGIAGDAGDPDLSDASKKVVGHYYVVSTAGSATPNGAGTEPSSWNVGDWCIYVEQGATDRWEKLDQTFVSGAGAAGQVTYWNSQNEVAGDNDLFFDSTNKRLGIGTTSPSAKLHISGADSTSSAIRQSRVGTVIWDQAIDSNGRLQWGTRATEGGTRTLRLELDDTGDVTIFPRATAASSGSGILYFKNVDDTSATINGGSIRTVDSTNNPSGADMRFQVANDSGTLFDAVTIDSNGFMGIGTTAPDQQLEVNGNIKVGTSFSSQKNIYFGDSNFSIRTENNYTTNNLDNLRFAVADNADAGFRFTNINDDELLYIKSENGNVGIGTTNPLGKLDVIGNTDDNTNFLTIQDNDPSANSHRPSIRFRSNTAQIGQIVSLNAGMRFSVGATEDSLLEIKDSGNVGIGTTSPGEKFTVEGDGSYMEITHPTATSFSGIKFSEGGTPQGSIQSIGSTFATTARRDNFEIFHNTGGNLTLQHSGGNVGIGTTSPLLNLQINSVTDSNATIAYSENNTLKWYTRHNASDDSFQIVDVPNTTAALNIASGGNVGIGTTSPVAKLHIYQNNADDDTTAGVTIEQDGTGDAALSFLLSSVRRWRLGIDNNDLDKFKISDSTNLATSNKLTIDVDGNVGIGTNNPTGKLEIQRSQVTTQFDRDCFLRLHPSATTDAGGFTNMFFGTSTTNNYGVAIGGKREGTGDGAPTFAIRMLDDSTIGTEVLNINTDGDLSIEKTSGSVFNLRRNDTSVVAGDNLGSIFFQGNDPSNPYKSGVAILGQGDGTWNMGSPNVYPSRLVFQTAEQNILKTAMVIKSDQKVGIGTTTPSYTLVVSDNGGSGIEFIPQTTNNRTTLLSYNRSGSAYSTFDFDASDIHFNISGSEKIRINSDGLLFVGDTTTTYGYSSHHIARDYSQGYALIVRNSNTSTQNNSVLQLNQAETTSTTQGYFLIGRQGDPSSGTNRILIHSNGDVKNVNNSYGAISDERLKENIVDATPKLDDLMKVKIRNYNFIGQENKQIGVIAQEIENVFPSLVEDTKDPESEETTKSVKYSVLVPIMLKAIQELEAKVKILENK